jgi:hypothetical protein
MDPKPESPNRPIAEEAYLMIKEYSEYSTIAGLIYVFMEDQVRML